MRDPRKAKRKIYEVAKDEATRNLQVKLTVLQAFVSNGIPWICNSDGHPLREPRSGARVVDFVPLNDRAFARWNTVDGKHPDYQNCEVVRKQLRDKYGEVVTHGPDSLDKRPEMRTLAHSLYVALRKKKREQELGENDSDKVTRLMGERDHWKAAAEAAGAHVLQSLDKSAELEQAAAELKRALGEAKVEVKDMERQMQLKDQEISLLKKQLAEITRLRRVQ